MGFLMQVQEITQLISFHIAGQTYIVNHMPNSFPVNCIGVSCPATITYAVTALNSTNIDFGLSMSNTNYDMSATWISCGGGGMC
jgi:hypothetical protein